MSSWENYLGDRSPCQPRGGGGEEKVEANEKKSNMNQMIGKQLHPMGLWLAVLAQALPAAAEEVQVRLGPLAPDGLLRGHLQWVSAGTAPLCFFTYPNLYQRPLNPDDELEAPQRYPRGFDPGWMVIDRVRGEESEYLPWVDPKLPASLRDLVACYRPAREGGAGSERLQVEYRLRVPRHYGAFGRYRDLLAADGGLYPRPLPRRREGVDYFSPPRSQALTLRWEGAAARLINGRYFPRDGGGKAVALGEVAEVSVFEYGAEPPQVEELSAAGFSARIFFLPGEGKGWREEVKESLGKLLWRLQQDIAAGLLPEGGDRRPVLVEAYLRRFLTARAQGMIPFSDRYIKVIPSLAKYHELVLQRALVENYLQPLLARREPLPDRLWVGELFGAAAAGRWGAKLYGATRDAREIGAVKLFSFHPALDQVLYTPQFPFVYAYYDSIYAGDPLAEGAELFNRRDPGGRVVLEKLVDLAGAEAVEEMLAAYGREGRTPLRLFSGRYGQRDLEPFFGQWLAPLPRLNYRLQILRREKQGRQVRTDFAVSKEESRPIQEKVEIAVREKGRPAQRFVFDGTRPRQDFSVVGDRPPEVIEIDPRGRLWETERGDNRHPPAYLFVLTNFVAGLDFNSREPYVDLSTQLRRRYGGIHRYNFSAFRGDSGYGFGIGYARLFGRLLDSLRLSHGASLTYSFSRLGADRLYLSRPGDPALFDPWLLTDSGFATALTLNYYFSNYLSYTNPLSGIGANLFATVGGDWLGGDYRYARFGGSASGIWPLSLDHLLAFRASLVGSLGSGTPTQLYLPLGGLYAERGIAVADPRYEGRHRLLLTAEYRAMIAPDLDLDLHLLRLRKIQGVLFADSGRVTGTKAALAFSRRDRTPFDSDFAGLLAIQDWSGDIGAGVRLFFDALGVRETLLRFDFARRTRDFNLHPWRYYLSFEQSF